MRGVGDDVGFVFEGNAGVAGMGDHRDRIFFPGLAAIERAAHEDAVAGGVVGPVVDRAQLVEGDVAEECMALIVVDDGDVAGNLVVGRRSAFGKVPGLPCIARIGHRGVLERAHQLPGIRGVHGNGGLSELTGTGRELDDAGARRRLERAFGRRRLGAKR